MKIRAFTLVEVMVSMAVLTVIVFLMISALSQSQSTFQRSSAKIEQFRAARQAFEAMTTRLSQATLNTYWDYDDVTNPKNFVRRSELRFISGRASGLLGSADFPTHAVFFHAPSDENVDLAFDRFESMLSVGGYFLEQGTDAGHRPAFISASMVPIRYRFRLMELSEPPERMRTYRYTAGRPRNPKYAGREWFLLPFNLPPATRPVRAMAENIIALVIIPRLARVDEATAMPANAPEGFSPLAPNYEYDSAPPRFPSEVHTKGLTNPIHQLPPILQVTMVAIDEASAQRLNLSDSDKDPFVCKDRFADTRRFRRDLYGDSPSDPSLSKLLIDRGVNYRIFTANVMIRAAKWSTEQVNTTTP